MSDLNSCSFSGRLGRDPETKFGQSGTAVCKFSIAVGKTWKKDGEKREQTLWLDCVSFGSLAEIAGKYLAKGARVVVSGELAENRWEDKDGNKRVKLELHMSHLTMLGEGKQQEAGGGRREEKKKTSPPPMRQPGEWNAKKMDEDEIPF